MVLPVGLLLVDKPAGPTSHDVVGRARRALKTKKVGHAGTLDPAATGLLILGVGPGTRLLRFIEAQHKRYQAVVTLGRSTTTEDGEGETVEERSVPVGPGLESAVRRAAEGLVGVIEQTVPAYSAVKVGGERLYRKARRQETVERPRRLIEVRSLEVAGVEGHEVRIEAEVSKGTYIRTLGVQLGAALGLPAHVSTLRRTHVGPWAVEDAQRLDAIEAGRLRPLVEALPATVEVDDATARRVVRGQPVSGRSAPAGPFGLLHPVHGLLGVAEARGPDEPWVYLCVLQGPDQVPS